MCLLFFHLICCFVHSLTHSCGFSKWIVICLAVVVFLSSFHCMCNNHYSIWYTFRWWTTFHEKAMKITTKYHKVTIVQHITIITYISNKNKKKNAFFLLFIYPIHTCWNHISSHVVSVMQAYKYIISLLLYRFFFILFVHSLDILV